MTALEDLKDFTACLWRTASLSHEDLDSVRAEAVAHPGSALNESCNCGAQDRLRGFDALTHLASVAAGLESVVLGEEQVIGQVRAALAEAPDSLRPLGDVAIAAARQLRRGVACNTHSGHLLDRGLMIAGLEARGTALILGTGHMARLVGRRALELGFEEVIIAGRRRPEADWFDENVFRYVSLDEIAAAAAVDVAVGCLGSNAPLVDVASELPHVRNLILDLGTPRNFHGETAIPLLDIATLLEAGHRHGGERREKLMADLREILRRRLTMARTTGRSSVGALRASVERIRRRETDRISRLHPDIPDETIEVITRALVNQLFHLPSERLKSIEDPELADRFVALFAEDLEVESALLAGSV
jgi:glutamyl-tRNA reductase